MKLRNGSLLIVMVVSFFVSPFLLQAAEKPAFGPQHLEIGKWHFHLSHHTFNLDRPGTGVVTITKNRLDPAIRGGFILLNLRFIPIRDFLAGDQVAVHFESALTPENSLIVFLRGTPKSSLNIAVQGAAVAAQPPVGTLVVQPPSITMGDAATLVWETAHADGVAIDNGIGNVPASGSQAVTPSQTTTYTLSATGPGGATTASATVKVDPLPPSVTIDANPDVVTTGQAATLTWASSNASGCFIEPDIGAVAPNGSIAVTPLDNTIYTLTATNPGGNTTATTTVTVLQPPQVSLTVDPPTIVADESTTLSWEAFHADSVFIDQGIGNVDNNGSMIVFPSNATVYTITAQGPGGTVSAHASVSVVSAPPLVEAYADVESILPGESTTLTWETTHAESCFIEPDIGEVDLSGSVQITPSLSTVFTITAHGSGQSAIARVAITVHDQTVDIINTIAGTGFEGYSGDGGPAVNAEIGEIADMAMDDAGNLYLADVDNRCIRKVSPNGIITTLAGGGLPEKSGDGGPATSAGFFEPASIAFDESGNLYIADAVACNIRKIDPDGIISTFAGPELVGRYPVDIVIDKLGNLYVSAKYDHQIRMIDPSGSESIVIAGSGNVGFSGDGGPAIHARLDSPNGLALDEAGNLYVADTDNDRIRKIDPSGIITTICGSDTYGGFLDVPGPAVQAGLGCPEKIMFDRNARLYIVDSGTHRVRRVDTHGVITTVAGKGLYHPAKQTGDAGSPLEALLVNPQAIFIQGNGHWYISEAHYPRIRKVAPRSAFPVLITSTKDGATHRSATVQLSGRVEPDAAVTVNGIPATVIGDTFQVDVPVAEGSNLLTAEATTDGNLIGFDSVRVEHLNQIFGMIDSVAGYGNLYGDRVDGNPAVNASISPMAVTVDKAENLYLVSRHRIYKVDQEGIIATVAGTADPGFSGDGGPALTAQLNEPSGMAVDDAGNLYVADTRNHRIRKIDSSGVITTVAGTGSNEWNGVAGPALELNLSYPHDVALDPTGNLFIADTQHYRVLKMDQNGFITFEVGQIEWVNPYVVYPAVYMLPTGIGISADGTLFIADQGNNVIWRKDGGLRTQVAGKLCYLCEPGYKGGEGIATEIRLNRPSDVAVDAEGALIISEEYGYRIRRVDPEGNLTTIVGRSEAPCKLGYHACMFESVGGDDGPSDLAQVYLPLSVAVGPSGAIYIADRNNHRVRRVREIGTTSSVAGTVSDAESGVPLSNAHVSLQHTSLSYDTDTASDGSFVFSNVTAWPGDLVVAVHAPGYISNRIRGTITNPSDDQTIDVTLFKSPELTLSIASPGEDSRVLASPVEVTGDISHAAAVFANGVEAVISGRTYTASVPLAVGINTITVTADDPYGQSAATHTQVTLVDISPTVNLNISSTEIEYGQSIELSWNSTNAETAIIEPGIGAVDVNGSLNLTPETSTTYTITVSGPGGTASAQTSVAVAAPLPSVTIDADPPSIVAGAFSSLTWRTTHADTVSIDQGIGSVEASGSMIVFPSETTTYTITAQGPGGTAAQTTTINVLAPEPEITFVVDRSSLLPGQSATLTWSTNHADTCTLAPDFGPVGVNGSAQVMPNRTTEYILTATGPGGTTTARVTTTVISAITVNITSPADNDFIARPDVMVCGTFTNSSGNETGITVNGKPAMVYGNTFAINHVSLLNGENTIAVTATDIDGQTRTEQISVNATQPAHHVTVNAVVESGSLPLASALAISGTFSIADSSLSFSGPGPLEITQNGADRYRIHLTDHGMYYLTAEVVHGAAVYADTIAMLGVDPLEIDLLLMQKWSDMKTALRSSDIEQALRYHHPRSQERYRAIYTALGSDLPTLAAQMEDISRIYCVDGTAKYRIRQTHDVDGRLVPITYYVYFVRDDNGLWRIQKY